MNWKAKNTIEALKERLLESVWMVYAHAVDSIHTRWSGASCQLENVIIHWPRIYQWPPAETWVSSLLQGFKKFVKIKTRDISQPYKGIVLVHLLIDQVVHEVAIDYSDYSSIDKECARRCQLYFKMQYSHKGYAFDHVVPGGFVSRGNDLYRFLPYLRSMEDRKKIFLYEVYGRFSLDFATNVRKKAIGILNEQKGFRYEGGSRIVRYSRFLREITQSKICIDLPGNGDFCFRLIDYLAVGACVIGPRHGTTLHVPLVDRKHIVYTKDDLSDLAQLCVFYLENPNAREEVCRESRAFFDQYLHRDQLANYYLKVCLEKLSMQ